MFFSVQFVPDYISTKCLTEHQLTNVSRYDRNDAMELDIAFSERVIYNRRHDYSAISAMLDHYHKDGVLVFSDNDVTMDGELVFVPLTVVGEDDAATVYVRCKAGCAALCTNPNTVMLREFRKWLVGYLVKRFGFDLVVRHELFTRLWLSNNF